MGFDTLKRRDLIVLALVVLLSLAAYLTASALKYRIGFPLDDAWIHLTYARNLAVHGEWSFLGGQASGGSTAPLWTFLLSIGFLLRLAPYVWTFALGGILLWCISVLGEKIARSVLPFYHPAYPWVGILVALEWHFAWAAFSGMETILYIMLVLVAVFLLLSSSRHYFLAGLLSGLAVWVRPDGLTLLGPFTLAVFFLEPSVKQRFKGWMYLLLGFGLLFLPYLLFNQSIAGTFMPNTFYAKQVEYQSWQLSPFGLRLFFFSLQFFQGTSLVMLPGFLLRLVGSVKKKDWGFLLAAAWMLIYSLIYILRLPVYQHGRYTMPALAVFFILGLLGLVEWFCHARRQHLVRSVAVGAVIVIQLLAIGIGIKNYSDDVAYIEAEMVDVARWVAVQVPPSALLAAHDIGALGYFAQRPLVDLAGLVSPDVIPIMNDDNQLAAYLDEKNVEYLVAFSAWRPALTDQRTILFASSAVNSSERLGDLTVYRWR